MRVLAVLGLVLVSAVFIAADYDLCLRDTRDSTTESCNATTNSLAFRRRGITFCCEDESLFPALRVQGEGKNRRLTCGCVPASLFCNLFAHRCEDGVPQGHVVV